GFDGLIHHCLCNWPLPTIAACRRLQPNQKRRAALKVETKVDLPATNHRPVRSLLIERWIGRPKAKRGDHDRQHRPQNAAKPLAFGREIPAEKHQYGEADKKSEHWGHGIFDPRSSIFDLLIGVACSVRLSNSNVLPYASFRTLVIADLSTSIFTLSATFSSTVVSFTFEIRP